ncbi:MAG: DUF1844 domain-containing protein [Planctomycetota bacterium]|nr:DUF1844 domain-containing protein [Planctomycetota bacterium]
MASDEPTPKLHVDSDWKAQAQAEKERLAAEEKTRGEQAPGAADDPGTSGAAGAGGPRRLPDANFKTLISVLASQALMGLGTIQDPESKGVMIDLDGARFSIDLLGVLEEKTKGNLSDEESSELAQLLAELRSRYVHVSRLVAEQAASGTVQSPGSPGAPGAPGFGGVGGDIPPPPRGQP